VELEPLPELGAGGAGAAGVEEPPLEESDDGVEEPEDDEEPEGTVDDEPLRLSVR
jgi:hypothetical protein